MWTKPKVKLIKKLQRQISALEWLHESQADSLIKQNRIWSLTIIISTYVLGTGGVVSVMGLLQESVNQKIIIYINLCAQLLIVLLGVFNTVYKSLNLPELIANHQRAYNNLNELYISIKICLEKPDDEKPRYIDFFSEIYRRKIQIKMDSGQIPHNLVRHYMEFINNKYDEEYLFGDLLSGEDWDSSADIKRDIIKSVI